MLYGEPLTHVIDDKTYLGYKASVPYPAKSAVLRMPTANEVAELFGGFAVKPKTESEADDKRHAAFAKLFKTVKQAGDDFDEYEATNVLNKMLSVQFLGIEEKENKYVVTLGTPFSETLHTLRPLSAKERSQIEKAAAANPNSYVAAVGFYDILVEGMPSGYASIYTVGDIPCHHKNQVLKRIIDEYDAFDPIKLEFSPNS
jgi:hypothetical protein